MSIRKETLAEGVELYLGDALTVLSSIPSVKASALICDPPYCSGGFTESAKRSARGQGLRSETLKDLDWFGGDNMTTAGLQWLLRCVAVEFKSHAISAKASASFFVDWWMVTSLATAIESAGLRFQSMPIWDKQAPGLGTGFRAQHECILHFSIETPEYHSFMYGNVLRFPRMPSDRDHPTEKPVPLMQALVEVQTPIGGMVLDPFMGSGSTGVASVGSGRRFIGVEHDVKHFDTACRRIEAALRSPSMFVATPELASQASMFEGDAAYPCPSAQ
jgi:DNA modification methylase